MSYTCQKCGKGAQEIGGYLHRVNEKGVPGIWECRPSCDSVRSFEENLLDAINQEPDEEERKTFKLGDMVTKTSGANWSGKIVGFYSTELTPEGYAVESSSETGSVQIYPVKALRLQAEKE